MWRDERMEEGREGGEKEWGEGVREGREEGWRE